MWKNAYTKKTTRSSSLVNVRGMLRDDIEKTKGGSQSYKDDFNYLKDL
jgi:hypothetical protein